MRKIFIISIILFSITIVILTLKLIKSINNKEIKQMFSTKERKRLKTEMYLILITVIFVIFFAIINILY